MDLKSLSAWFVKFSCLLTTYGFTPSTKDPTIVCKMTSYGMVTLVVYVDDILFTGTNEGSIFIVMTYLHQKFVMHNL